MDMETDKNTDMDNYMCIVHIPATILYSNTFLYSPCSSTTVHLYSQRPLMYSRWGFCTPHWAEAIFTNSSRTLFAKCSQTYSYLLGRVGGGGGGRRASVLLLPPPPLPCRTLYCTSVQFTNFVRELLVNIASAVLLLLMYYCPSPTFSLLYSHSKEYIGVTPVGIKYLLKHY
jgi:hypothetical protein